MNFITKKHLSRRMFLRGSEFSLRNLGTELLQFSKLIRNVLWCVRFLRMSAMARLHFSHPNKWDGGSGMIAASQQRHLCHIVWWAFG